MNFKQIRRLAGLALLLGAALLLIACGELTPANETVNPTAQNETVTPTAQSETVTPTAQSKTVTPTAQNETVTPTAQNETATPTAQNETVTPTAQNETVTPTAQNETASLSSVVNLLGNATYDSSISFSDEVVKLTSGRWEGHSYQEGGGGWQGEPYQEGAASRPSVGLINKSVAMGDLTGDGQDEAVAVLWSNGGGSGTFRYLVVMRLANQEAKQIAATLLGDRVELK